MGHSIIILLYTHREQVAHTSKPLLLHKQEDLCDVETSLIYIWSCRLTETKTWLKGGMEGATIL